MSLQQQPYTVSCEQLCSTPSNLKYQSEHKIHDSQLIDGTYRIQQYNNNVLHNSSTLTLVIDNPKLFSSRKVHTYCLGRESSTSNVRCTIIHVFSINVCCVCVCIIHNMCVRVCMHVRTCVQGVCVCVCVYLYVHVCMYECMHVCMYVCVCDCVCTHLAICIKLDHLLCKMSCGTCSYKHTDSTMASEGPRRYQPGSHKITARNVTSVPQRNAWNGRNRSVQQSCCHGNT